MSSVRTNNRVRAANASTHAYSTLRNQLQPRETMLVLHRSKSGIVRRAYLQTFVVTAYQVADGRMRQDLYKLVNSSTPSLSPSPIKAVHWKVQKTDCLYPPEPSQAGLDEGPWNAYTNARSKFGDCRGYHKRGTWFSQFRFELPSILYIDHDDEFQYREGGAKRWTVKLHSCVFPLTRNLGHYDQTAFNFFKTVQFTTQQDLGKSPLKRYLHGKGFCTRRPIGGRQPPSMLQVLVVVHEPVNEFGEKAE
ncbi:hypothetical protein B0H34DRAFT_678729 [Crassisporium funariophilum]|nr:hypothetical protein B0H34DRAFT_678729 [Crassisporium funariophilum]